MADPRLNSIATKIRLQRLVLWMEAVWPALQRPLIVIAIGLSLLWSGVFLHLPTGLPVLLLAGLGLLLIFSLAPLMKMVFPSRLAAARVLEKNNTLSHRAASSLEDVPVTGAGSAELWQAHVERNLAAIKNLSVAAPRSSWRQFDPLALRLPMVMAVFTSFLLGSGEIKSSLQSAFYFAMPAPAKAPVLDAWLKPPTYTGKPPLLLTSPAMQERLAANPELDIPENSLLSLRLQGAAKPRLLVLSPGTPDQEVKLAEMKAQEKDGTFTVDAKLDRPATLKVFDGNQVLATWQVTTITDEPPKIEFVDEPKGDDTGKLSVKWHANDDYGVKSVTAEIVLADQQDNAEGFEGNGVFLYPAPEFKIAMAKPNSKDETETSLADLASHPWAGLWVEMTLTASDAAGHKTSTAPKRLRMPERDFIMPLAHAFAEQRKRFILSPDDAPDAATMIGAMLLYPFELNGRMGLQINIAGLNARLANASHPDDVVAAVKDFWPLIQAVEDGNLGDSKTRLKQLADQLRQALREGASKERIQDLMKKLQDEMNKLAQQMQKDAEQRLAEGVKPTPGPMVSPEQLQDMLDQIGKLNEQGNTDQAEQMLSQLDQMLQNLRPGQGQMAEGGQPGQGQMNGLSGLLDKQQKLMDQTQRLGQGGKGTKPGENNNGGDGDSAGDLANRQKGLRDQLDQLGKGLSPQEGGDKLGEAQKNMGDAEDALRQGNKDEALRQQNKAMRNMIQGMGKLAEQMGKQGGDKQGNANGQGNSRNQDPLGRLPNRRPNVGPDKDIVPSDIARKKAREILEELRARSNEQGLDSETKSYLNGLLQGLE